MPRSPAGPVAGRQVLQDELEPVLDQPPPDLRGRVGIGELALHRLEAGTRGALEAVEEGPLGEQHREVGGKLGHRADLSREPAQALRGARGALPTGGPGVQAPYHAAIAGLHCPRPCLITRSS